VAIKKRCWGPLKKHASKNMILNGPTCKMLKIFGTPIFKKCEQGG